MGHEIRLAKLLYLQKTKTNLGIIVANFSFSQLVNTQILSSLAKGNKKGNKKLNLFQVTFLVTISFIAEE